MMKIKTSSVALGVSLLVWMLVIFLFSAQPSDDSQSTSDIFTCILQRIFYPNFSSLTEIRQTEILEQLSYFVRKTAHFTAFFILGILAFFNVISLKRFPLGLKSVIAVAFCFLYAISDEIHQYFVPGRYCAFSDVCIDTSGAILSVLVLFLIFRFSKKLNNRVKR